MPHVALNKVNKLSIQALRALESGRYLSMSFHSWKLYEYPLLPSTTKHSWAIKIAIQLEKPRYVPFALQTVKKNIIRHLHSATNMFQDTNHISATSGNICAFKHAFERFNISLSICQSFIHFG